MLNLEDKASMFLVGLDYHILSTYNLPCKFGDKLSTFEFEFKLDLSEK